MKPGSFPSGSLSNKGEKPVGRWLHCSVICAKRTLSAKQGALPVVSQRLLTSKALLGRCREMKVEGQHAIRRGTGARLLENRKQWPCGQSSWWWWGSARDPGRAERWEVGMMAWGAKWLKALLHHVRRLKKRTISYHSLISALRTNSLFVALTHLIFTHLFLLSKKIFKMFLLYAIYYSMHWRYSGK